MRFLKLVFVLILLIAIIGGGYYLYRTVISNQLQKETTTEVTPVPLPPDQQVDEDGPRVGVNATLSPVFVNIIMDPAATASAQFKVINNNPFVEHFKVDILKFGPDRAGSSPVPIEVEPGDEFVKWIKFDEPQFDVEPNQAKTLRFTVSTPKNADLGYYFAVMITRVQERIKSESGAIVAGAPTLPVLLEVKSPSAKKQAQFINFKTTQPVYEYLPVEFQLQVKNQGNIHLIPFGDIFIDQGENNQVGTIPVNPTRGNILPNTTRTYTTTWSDGFLVRVPKKENGEIIVDAAGKTVYETKWDLTAINKLRIGKFNATAVMVYDNGQRDVPMEAKISFVVFPWKIILVIILVLLLILFGIFSIIRAIISPFRSRDRK